jgi:hypothetical protein
MQVRFIFKGYLYLFELFTISDKVNEQNDSRKGYVQTKHMLILRELSNYLQQGKHKR